MYTSLGFIDTWGHRSHPFRYTSAIRTICYATDAIEHLNVHNMQIRTFFNADGFSEHHCIQKFRYEKTDAHRIYGMIDWNGVTRRK